jgi:hypothetical protein
MNRGLDYVIIVILTKFWGGREERYVKITKSGRFRKLFVLKITQY